MSTFLTSSLLHFFALIKYTNGTDKLPCTSVHSYLVSMSLCSIPSSIRTYSSTHCIFHTASSILHLPYCIFHLHNCRFTLHWTCRFIWQRRYSTAALRRLAILVQQTLLAVLALLAVLRGCAGASISRFVRIYNRSGQML